jgi:hydroxymethylpyrimidine pyrophosphatase-like HAD family hydrolase
LSEPQALVEAVSSPVADPRAAGSWRPALVALDIDGTIVDHDGLMPPDVHETVRRVVDAGVPVVLATGRAWHSTQPIVDLLALPAGPTISSNGAVVVSYPPLEILHARTFDPAQVIRRVQEFAPGTLIAVEEIGRGFRLSGQFPHGDLTGEMVIEDVDQLSSRPVTRVILRDPDASDQDFVRLAEHLGLHGVTYFVGWSAWLDIAPEGADKATALAGVARELGIGAADVLALGDGRNDIEMLRWAGRGVALGDAPPEVQQAADHVTGRFADGGTVAELSRWF